MALEEHLKTIKENMSQKLTVQEAAEIMGVTPQFLRAALQQEKFPFGVAVEMKQNEFYINAYRFILYMEGEDMRSIRSEDVRKEVAHV